MTFVFDITKFNANSPAPNVINTINNKTVNYFNSISLGLPYNVNYTFPTVLGTSTQYLKASPTTKEIIWADAGSGGGDVVNGGQSGPLTIGADDINGEFNLGFNTTNINFRGGTDFQHDIISSPETFTLTNQYFFVEFTNGVKFVNLPAASTADGRIYIISKKYVGDELTIMPFLGDTIDNHVNIKLYSVDSRIQLISNGINKWFII